MKGMLRARRRGAAFLFAAATGALLAAAGGCGRARRSAARPVFRKNPDVVLITIDTLRADALGFAGNRRVESPVLDRLAAQGLVFVNAHAHNVMTLPSHANILTGLYPYMHGVRDNAGCRLERKTPTLATWLKERGYATGAFVGAFPLDSRFGLSRGFDVYDDRYPKGRSGLDFETPERPAREVIAAALAWFEKSAGKPRFLWVHLFDCHAPYRPSAPFAERYRDNPYLGEVAAVDEAVQPLLDPFLSGRAPPAVIVVTGDHGEALGDHGELTHGLFAYEATLRVPLLVWMPGAVAAGRSSRLARHVDVAPTILAAAGLETPAGLPGGSLLAPSSGPEREDVSYFEAYSAAYGRGWAPLRGVVGGGFKYIDLPLPELYDLGADPGEANNRIDADRERARRLAAALVPESVLGAGPRAGSAEDAARLRSLGYLSGGSPLKEHYGPEDDPKRLVGVDRQVHEAIDRYQRGDLPGAIQISRRLVEEAPAMAAGYENLAFLLRQSPRPSEALDVYRQALARDAATEQIKARYGLALCEAGRAREALALLTPLAGSDDPDTVNALGVAYADSGSGAEAEQAFARALALDPENAEAYGNRGILRLRAGDAGGAREEFRKALEIDPRFPRAWNGLGVALARLGDERSAIDCWEKAVEGDPRLYDALFNIGLTAGKNGLREQSRRALERFVATAPPAIYGDDIARARRFLATLK